MKLENKLKVYRDVINGLSNGDIRLSKEQLEYLKKLGLKKGYVIGMHNTIVNNPGSFFDIGLYNNRDYLFSESCDLRNTVAYSSLFISDLFYCADDFNTIIVMIPEDVIEGKKGIFEKLKNGLWGIPSEYIVASFYKGKIHENSNYNEKYYNPNAKPIEDPKKIERSFEDRKEEILICSKAFDDYQKLKNNSLFKNINKRRNSK